MFHDYYEILGIDPEADPEEIKRAYRIRAREAHPDHHPDDADIQTAEMSLINEAYDVLGDPRRRRSYDSEWQRYYSLKGHHRRAGRKPATFDHEYRTSLGQPDTREAPTAVPFWKNQRVLATVLAILIVILLVDIYYTYFGDREFGKGVVRDIALGYEFAFGRRFRERASERHLRRGLELPDESVRERLWQLNRALALDPDNIGASLEAGRLLFELGRFEDALAISRRGLARIDSLVESDTEGDLETTRIGLLDIVSQALIRLGRMDEAFDFLLILEQIDPENEKAILDLAWIEMQLGLTTNATDRVQAFLENYPDSEFAPAAHAELARAYLTRGHYSDAVQAANEGLETAPDDPALHLVLGEALHRLGQYESAAEHLLIALPDSPDPTRVHLLIADCCLLNGRPYDSIAHFNAVIEARPNSFEAHMGLGNAYFNLGMMDEARSEFFTAIQIRPDDRAAREAFERIPSLSDQTPK